MLCDQSNQITIDYISLKANAILRSSLASLTITQRFLNSNQSPVEGTYKIVQQASVVLAGLKAIFEDGSVTELKVLEKELAKEKFQDALAQGNLPILGESKVEVLELSIGHLPSGQSLEIVSNYVFPLSSKEDFWKFEMPPVFDLNPSLQYEVLIQIPSTLQIQSYNSNWDLDYTLINNILTATYNSSTKPYNKDQLEFSYKTNQNIKPTMLIQSNGEDYAAMLSFIPYCTDQQDIDDYEPAGEFLFIVDRSGSMSGNRIELAKEAACLFLKSLTSQSKFNIISFGDVFSFLYPDSVLANSANVSDAISKISKFSADMGGTEIYQPLHQVYSKNLDKGLKRFIFLLTDGDVSSPGNVVGLIEQNQDKGKVFSFGIEDANEFLIRESAKKGNGESYYIRQAVDIGKNVIKALGTCVSPYVENVNIDLNWDFAPKLQSIKWVNYGSRFCVFSLGKEITQEKCVMTCFDSFKGTELRFEILSSEVISGDEIFKLWAKSRIEDDPDNSLEISLKYQVISPKTAYFASKKNDTSLSEEIVPAIIKSKTENIFLPVAACYSMPLSNRNLVYDIAGYEDEEEREELFGEDCVEMRCCKYEDEDEGPRINSYEPYLMMKECEETYFEQKIELIQEKSSANLSGLSSTINTTQGKHYLKIVMAQDSEGFWEWSKLILVINVSLEVLALENIDDNKIVVATCLALAYLNKFFLQNRDEWMLVEKKAVKWLKKNCPNYLEIMNKFMNALN